jgi:hypothetical protein
LKWFGMPANTRSYVGGASDLQLELRHSASSGAGDRSIRK